MKLNRLISIEELCELMQEQADLRSQENDEAGCIIGARIKLEIDVAYVNSLEEI